MLPIVSLIPKNPKKSTFSPKKFPSKTQKIASKLSKTTKNTPNPPTNPTPIVAKYTDCIYFPNKQIGFVYEEDSEKLLKFFKNSNELLPVYKTKLYDGCNCRQLSKSPDNQTLILNKGDNSIVLFRANSGPGSPSFDWDYPIVIESIAGKEVRSAKSLGNEHIVTISDDGFMAVYYFSFEDLTTIAVRYTKLPLKEDEEVSCMAICCRGEYMAVASSFNLKASQLFVFRVERGCKPVIAARASVKDEPYSAESLSFFQDLNMDYYIGDYPVMLGFQYDAENMMVPYVFDGEDISYLSPPQIYHSNMVGKCVFVEGDRSVWSADKNGTIKKLTQIA